jgi:hypothetical protein
MPRLINLPNGISNRIKIEFVNSMISEIKRIFTKMISHLFFFRRQNAFKKVNKTAIFIGFIISNIF